MTMPDNDKKILFYIQKFKFLNRHQIQELVFTTQNQAQVVCNRRLLKLTKTKQINRFRPSLEEPFVYHIENKIPQWQHCVEVVNVFLTLRKMMNPSKEFLESFEVEKILGRKRADAIIRIKFKDLNISKTWAIEVDRASEPLTKFDKVQNYTELYMDDKWKEPVIIITVPGRVKRLQEKIREENVLDLNFTVCDLEEFKQGKWKMVDYSDDKETKHITETNKIPNVLLEPHTNKFA